MYFWLKFIIDKSTNKSLFITSVVLDGYGLDGVHPIVHSDQDDAEEGEDGGDNDHHHPPDEHTVSWQPRLLYYFLLGNLFLTLEIVFDHYYSMYCLNTSLGMTSRRAVMRMARLTRERLEPPAILEKRRTAARVRDQIRMIRKRPTPRPSTRAPSWSSSMSQWNVGCAVSGCCCHSVR